MTHNIAIIGAGLIGRKRAKALAKFANCNLAIIADVDEDAARRLAGEFGGEVESDWRLAIKRNDVDIVVVATYNKHLLPISIAALESGKHVLCEKPLGRNSNESKKMVEIAKHYKKIIKTGFNHRHHPAISRAKNLFDSGAIGKLCFIRCRYGHGGRPGYDKEWRADKDLCGGGELLDQGVHVVDLFRWFAGDFDSAFGYLPTYFWDMKVEDNAVAIFKNRSGVVASMHTSWTQWKNVFSFEVFGRDGYLVVDGLGGSYGPETLKVGKRRPEGGPPGEEVLEFPGEDISWEEEWKEFISAIEAKRKPLGSGLDGYEANRMIRAVYKSAKTGEVIRMEELD